MGDEAPLVVSPTTRRTVRPAEIATRSSPGWSREVADLLGRRVEPVQRARRVRMELQRVDPARAGRLSGDERRDKLVGHGVASRMPRTERPQTGASRLDECRRALALRPPPVRPTGEDLRAERDQQAAHDSESGKVIKPVLRMLA